MNAERRPGLAPGTASEAFDDRAILRPFDLLTASRHDLDVYFRGRHDGYLCGHADGWAEGYAACDEEIAALQRAAVASVRAVAELPVRHPEFLTATDEELVAAAIERHRRSVQRFRGDHARRRAGVPS